MNATEGQVRDTVPRALFVLALASGTVFLLFGASNAGVWSFSGYLMIPSLAAFLAGAAVVVWVHQRGGSLPAVTVAALLGALLLTGGGRLLERFQGWGIVVLGVVVATTYLMGKRLFAAFPLGWLTPWLTITLALINGVSLVQIIAGEVRTPETAAGATLAVDKKVNSPDVVVLVLDEFASPTSSQVSPVHFQKLQSLEGDGYEVPERVLAPYTISAIAIPAILDGSYPLSDGDDFNHAAKLELGAVSRGAHRLARTLKAAGYRFTQVESGLWMTGCGSQVDVCVENQPLDEALGVLLNRSALRWWYQRQWGDAFIVAGLHSMAETRRVLLEYAANDTADLVVSHILLPHFPYLLGEDCLRHPQSRYVYTHSRAALEAYSRQAGCVVGWLTGTLTDLDRASVAAPAVVVTGDHGTNLAGQLTRPVERWTDDEVAERLSAFAAYRLPTRCTSKSAVSTPQIIDVLLACFTSKEAVLERRHFLVSNAGRPAPVVEYGSEQLDTLVLRSANDMSGDSAP